MRTATGKSHRGFAAMDPKKQKEIASKGGTAVSRNRTHMAEIGRKGGETVSKDRGHMAEIGRKGGEASHGKKIPNPEVPNGEPGSDSVQSSAEEQINKMAR